MSATVTTHEIAESLRARIAAVREELERYDSLREELARLESALADLEPAARVQRRARNPKTPGSAPRRSRASRPADARATASRRAPSSSKGGPRGQTRDRIIEFIRAQGPATAGEIATGLNLNRNSVATRLTQLTKAGELQKAERGYTTPATNGTSKT
jgi:type II secretory pathway component HofQ